ncbi:hypothetical protein E2562_016434 [Oryza meyeriana var. granulata]|uniref:Uncharacterized protein n=1 Tax=Oryza meyeriana var. granulata TaxID=110450 RepID=A0A6G1EX37_9ORYZ|nr:hypothetical protein E2562_016434 [Oryza meyeriana var. granulata]
MKEEANLARIWSTTKTTNGTGRRLAWKLGREGNEAAISLAVYLSGLWVGFRPSMENWTVQIDS